MESELERKTNVSKDIESLIQSPSGKGYMPNLTELKSMYGDINKPYIEKVFSSAKCCGCRSC